MHPTPDKAPSIEGPCGRASSLPSAHSMRDARVRRAPPPAPANGRVASTGCPEVGSRDQGTAGRLAATPDVGVRGAAWREERTSWLLSGEHGSETWRNAFDRRLSPGGRSPAGPCQSPGCVLHTAGEARRPRPPRYGTLAPLCPRKDTCARGRGLSSDDGGPCTIATDADRRAIDSRPSGGRASTGRACGPA